MEFEKNKIKWRKRWIITFILCSFCISLLLYLNLDINILLYGILTFNIVFVAIYTYDTENTKNSLVNNLLCPYCSKDIFSNISITCSNCYTFYSIVEGSINQYGLTGIFGSSIVKNYTSSLLEEFLFDSCPKCQHELVSFQCPHCKTLIDINDPTLGKYIIFNKI